MGELTDTFRRLIKLTGQTLFVIGLVLNICMLFFGIWPSFIYLLIMLVGAGLVIANKNGKAISKEERVFSWVLAFLGRIQNKYLCPVLIAATLTFLLGFGVILLNQDYFKRHRTIDDCIKITAALDLYKDYKKVYPPDLKTLIGNNPTRANWREDRWGVPYKYSIDDDTTTFVLTSAGKDGEFGTDDDIVFKN